MTKKNNRIDIPGTPRSFKHVLLRVRIRARCTYHKRMSTKINCIVKTKNKPLFFDYW